MKQKSALYWVVPKDDSYKTNDDTDLTYFLFEEANTEADARAKMLIYLLENKLI